MSPGHALTFGPRIMAWSLGLGHEPRAYLDLWPYNYGLELGPRLRVRAEEGKTGKICI